MADIPPVDPNKPLQVHFEDAREAAFLTPTKSKRAPRVSLPQTKTPLPLDTPLPSQVFTPSFRPLASEGSADEQTTDGRDPSQPCHHHQSRTQSKSPLKMLITPVASNSCCTGITYDGDEIDEAFAHSIKKHHCSSFTLLDLEHAIEYLEKDAFLANVQDKLKVSWCCSALLGCLLTSRTACCTRRLGK